MIKGIDVSHWQPHFDYKKAKADGCEFLVCKISESTNYVDDQISHHLNGARANGMLTGGYHFMRCNIDGEAQANYFLMHYPKTDLPPILDLEQQSAMGMSHNHCKNQALAWLKRVELKTGRVPMIYGGSSFLAELGLDAQFARYPLWVAQYASRPHIPHPWAKATIWQFSDGTYNRANSEQHGDTDWFLGSRDELHALAKG